MAYDPTSSGWTSQTDPEPARPTGVEYERGPEVAKVSTSVAATATSGTIATAGVGVARVSPAAAVTGVILQAGTVTGQQVIVVNEAVSANTITFAAAGTSHVADGTTQSLAGTAAQLFVWDATTSLWYRGVTPSAYSVVQSSTAAAVTTSGTITTAGVQVARVAPAAAVTAVVLQAGTSVGQRVTVVNEATAANSVTFAASGASNVANGTGEVIAGVTAKSYVWDSATSLWYTGG